jgi:hypothetical protein
VLDSNSKAEFCRAVEHHSGAHSYVNDHALGFDVPHLMGR